ncbi:MAG: TRAP transporter substrate-binding protein [Candidatus Rokubacteria bacterium]|nr:TRAP transporter substrate-binding protein [Candidatus Rokubacteria bacterium]MBI2157708.1 TRAP transporter substrate-binding protein [Candidatus Rokubacteria bacterium]
MSLILALAVVLAAGSQPTTAQAPITLKMQASWPAALTLYDNFKLFAERVEKISGGRLKIEAMPAGTIVPAFEVLDATNKKVLDGAHTWAAYWVGKHKAAVLFTGGPGGTFGMDFIDALGWMYEGGGIELYQQFYKDVLKLNVVPIPILPAGPQAFGWFKRPIKNLADFKGMKCRETGIAAEVFTEMGMRVVNMPGGEIIPSAERGVIDCAEWVGGVEDLKLGFQNVWKYYYTPGMHENVTIGELIINGDVWAKLAPDLQEIIKAAAHETFFRWWARWQKQNAEALKELQEKHKVQILKTPDEILYAFLKAWDKIAAREAEKDPFFKKVLESQRAYARLVVPAKRFAFPNYDFAANYYWPVKPAAAAAPAAPAAKPAAPAKK